MTQAAPATPPTRPTAAFTAELGFATDLARLAGDLLMDRYERVERISKKSARDVVTEVDHLSEELILDAIRATYPDDAILAEESGEHHAVPGAAPPGEGRTWVVDPLDGTINYANGIPFFCVSIALVVGVEPAVAVVRDPTRDETFAATRDAVATRDGEPIGASDKDDLGDFVISMALSGRALASRARALRKAIRVPRSMGAAALALSYVGNGRFDAFVQQGGLSVWDVAAAGLIAERGGATVTDLAGGPWFALRGSPKSIGIVAAPAAHHAALLELVRA